MQSPSTHFLCLFWDGLFTIIWGTAAIFGGALSSAFSVLMNMDVEVSLGGSGHDALATNKLEEAGMVFGHGVSSLVSGAVAVVVALGCCALVGMSPLGVEGSPSPWNLLIGGLGIS